MVLGDMGINFSSTPFYYLLTIYYLAAKAKKKSAKGEITLEELLHVNWSLIAPILILQFILTIAALISCIKQEDTNGPKWLWILLILFISLFGPILYFVVGRRNN